MHQYLRDEEADLMSQLKQEEEDKSHRMREKIDQINSDIHLLTNSIRETEDAMSLEDFLFLKVIDRNTFRLHVIFSVSRVCWTDS